MCGLAVTPPLLSAAVSSRLQHPGSGAGAPAVQAAAHEAVDEYQTQQLIRALERRHAATRVQIGEEDDEQAHTQWLQEQLTAVGNKLTAFAVAEMCNHPACANVAGPSDVALVSGPGCVCGGCLTERY